MATKHVIVACILVLFTSQAALPQQIQQISNTREASCIIQITTDNSLMPLDYMTIESIVQSAGVKEKALLNIFGTSKINIKVSTEPQVDRLPASPVRTKDASGNIINLYTIKLIVEFPGELSDKSKDILIEMENNLRKTIEKTFYEYGGAIHEQSEKAMENFKEAESKLNELTEEVTTIVFHNSYNEYDRAVMRQLNEEVDLHQIEPSMSFEEVLAEIKNSIIPPLQIQPNWRDLADIPDIMPTTPAEMGPLTGVKVRAALDNLLSGLSTIEVPLGYIVRDGVIIIASKDALPNNLVTTVYDISGFLINGRSINTLIQAIKETIEPESWYDSDTDGEGKIIDMQGGKISVINTPEVQNQIVDFLANFPKEIPTGPLEGVSLDNLIVQREGLTGQKQMLELDIARLEARQDAVEQQIVSLSGKVKNINTTMALEQRLASLAVELEHLKTTRTENHPDVLAIKREMETIKKQIDSSVNDSITTELEKLVTNQTERLELLKKQHEEQVRASLAPRGIPDTIIEAEEKLVQTKIELAKRREELAIPVGIERLSGHNELLSNIVIELAGKKAEYKVIERQLSEIEGQIQNATTTDPKVLKFRQAKKVLEEAEKKLNELKEKEANLQPPIVIAIGLD